MMKTVGSSSVCLLLTTIGLLTTQAWGQDRTIESYSNLSYSEMQFKLADLATIFPDVMRLERADTKLDIPYLVDCDDNGNKCVLDIVTVTDFLTSSDNKVQVYISGSLNGEALGAQIAYYLIEYLVSNFKRDVFVRHLLQTREIVITPMTNSYGYATGSRRELY